MTQEHHAGNKNEARGGRARVYDRGVYTGWSCDTAEPLLMGPLRRGRSGVFRDMGRFSRYITGSSGHG